MSEQIINRYRPLFEIQLLHHYWLDEGETVFDLLKSPHKNSSETPEDENSEEKRNKEKRKERLRSYDCRRFFVIEPTAGTAKVLSGLGCVYKSTSLGCLVAVPKGVTVSFETMLEFVVTVRDAALFNYTALTLRPQTIHEFYYKPEKKTYRYKENVPVLSNLTGTVRDMGPEDNTVKTLFLSKEFPTTVSDNDQAESFFIENDKLKQLTGDQPNATSVILYDRDPSPTINKLPIFVHQDDIPVVVPPDGLAGAPERGLLLSDDIPDNIFTLIRLAAIRGDDEGAKDFNLIDDVGQAKENYPVFHLRFKNRSTFWRYLIKKTGKKFPENSETPAKDEKIFPLTHFGNVGTGQKPSKEFLVKAEKNDGDKIIKLVSEIFI